MITILTELIASEGSAGWANTEETQQQWYLTDEGSDSDDSFSALKLFKKERDIRKVTKPAKGHNVLAITVVDSGCGIND